jgi:hypothetical protein
VFAKRDCRTFFAMFPFRRTLWMLKIWLLFGLPATREAKLALDLRRRT